MDERSLEENIKIKARESRKLARYMSSTQDLVEEQIRKAQEKGAFDHLQGSGKPLDLEENPYVPEELRLVFKILKDNDYAPYWIELGKEIDSDLERWQREVESFKQYTRIFFREKPSARALKHYYKKWDFFCYERRLDLERIDKKVTDYNLHCPTFREGRGGIAMQDKMFKMICEMEDLIEELRNQ